MRLRPVHISFALLAACAAALGWVEWRRQSFDASVAGLVRHLPAANATQVYLDVQALRSAGLLEMLAGSKAAQETEYRDFVDRTKFDYTQDLDGVLASFQGAKKSFLLRGRFDWDQIRRYAEFKGAKCVNGFCAAETKRPGQFISHFALAPNVLALSVSDNEWGAQVLRERRDTGGFQPPPHAVWLTMPESALNGADGLPDGLRAFLGAIRGADRATISLAPRADAFQAELAVTCKSVQQGSEIHANLDKMTDLLRKFLARAKQEPNPRDLAGVLSGGRFTQDGAVVKGVWPIEKVFLELLAEGNI